METWIENIQQNIRLLKALRRMSDEDIALAGQFNNRQVVSTRLTGRTRPDTEDLFRFAAALRVDPVVLLSPSDEAMRWIADHPDYLPPVPPKAIPKRISTSRSSS